jgi:hypothetical protein
MFSNLSQIRCINNQNNENLISYVFIIQYILAIYPRVAANFLFKH